MQDTDDEDKEAKLSDLNPEQRQRLEEFAKKHGSTWRATLHNMWWTGDDARQTNGHLLRQIRNQFGPVWLANLKEL